MENSLALPQKVKQSYHLITLLGIYSRKWKAMATQKFTLALFISAKSWTMETIQMFINWWMNRQNVAYPYNEVLLFSHKRGWSTRQTLIKLRYVKEGIHKKDHILHEMSKIGKSIKTENRLVVA